jgi:hypothetical protein
MGRFQAGQPAGGAARSRLSGSAAAALPGRPRLGADRVNRETEREIDNWSSSEIRTHPACPVGLTPHSPTRSRR